MVNFCHLPSFNLLWVKTAWITHVLPPYKDIVRKISFHVMLLRLLVGSRWSTGTKTLHTAALSLVYATAEYCTPIWCCSAHTCLIDSVWITPCALSLDSCILHQRTTCQSFQAFSQLSFAAWERHYFWPGMAPWTHTIFYMVN